MPFRAFGLAGARLAPALLVCWLAARSADGQVAGAAGVATSVPVQMGPVELRAGAFSDRIGSSIAPRTTLTIETSARMRMFGGGAWLGASAMQVHEIDTLPVRPLLAFGLWRSFSDITLRVGSASHVARLGGRTAGWRHSSSDSIVVRRDSLGNPEHIFSPDSSYDNGTPSKTQLWSDVELGLSWSAGRMVFDASVITRPAVASFPRTAWGRVTGTYALTTLASLITTVGTQAAQIGLGVPTSRFASLAVSVTPGRRKSEADSASAATSAPFSVRAATTGRYAITYRLSNAHRVELSGDFNKWAPVEMHELRPGVWTTDIAIAPGTYRMNVRVDGGPWTAPPGATKIDDEFNGAVGLVVVR